MNTISIKTGSVNKVIIFVMFFLFINQTNVIAQNTKTIWKNEKLIAYTDRSLYAAGEEVRFAAFDYSKDTLGRISTVLYSEIISPDGDQIANGKFEINDRKSSGCLVIPTDQVSGNYYLRVYTKYMRNFGPNSFYYIPITIVNPQNSKVMDASDTSASIHPAKKYISNDFDININNKIFGSHENVQITISGKNQVQSNIMGLSVAVVPGGSDNNQGFTPAQKNITVNELSFLPETRGPSISGIVKDSTSGKPIKDVRINLSIIGKGRDFIATQTNPKGHFNISLPFLDGSRDLFISSGNVKDDRPQIWIDNDFSTTPISIPTKPFNLNENQKVLALQIARNNQVSELYNLDTSICKIETKLNDTSVFYGHPSYVLNLSDYIQLPTIEEYFNELPTQVKVRKKDGKKYFKVLGPQPGMEYFAPLVMVDMVAIDNPELILKATPSEISRVEVINKIYVKGDYSYGGIVNFISKHNDFAGIDLPHSGLFIHYLFLSETCHCNVKVPGTNKPDSRNTVYWNPNLKLEKGKSLITFVTPDTPGNYDVIIRGVTKMGTPIYQKISFKVEN
ncbi:MAG: hypothetical protein JXR65_05405 [Bacteroidales bacterium]|nr:hypothetical protein [Bacteroidales bacterium]